jgi:hypothetical protein
MWIEKAVFTDEPRVFVVNGILNKSRHCNFRRLCLGRHSPLLLIFHDSGPSLIKEHVCRVQLELAAVAVFHGTAKSFLWNFCRIKRIHLLVIEVEPRWRSVASRIRPLANVGIVVTVLTISEVHHNTNKVKEVFFMRFRWVAQVLDGVQANVNGFGESKMLVNLLPTKVSQIKVKSFEMKDQVIGCGLEACPRRVSFELVKPLEHLPFDSVHELATTSLAFVLVVSFHNIALHESLEALL